MAETGSFTQAAAALNYSQSAISQAIKKLEQEVGTTLFTRKHDGLILTPDGLAFSAYLKDIALAENRLAEKVRETKGLKQGVIRLGTISSITRSYLPEKLRVFHQQHPGIRFSLRQNDYNGIVDWVNENQVDLGFVDPDLASSQFIRVVYEDELVAVLPKGHPFSQRKCISASDLANEDFILMDEGTTSSIRHAILPYIDPSHILYTVYDDDSIIRMVHLGMGVSVLSTSVLHGFEREVDIVPLSRPIKRKIALTWKHWETIPYAARKFAEFLFSESP